MVISFVGALYIVFGLYCSAIWGDTIQLIITNQFDGGINPETGKNMPNPPT